ncbi:hypothetical protein JVT61DRAFT_10344 [Boletus reticuloceps]|uniref:Uncharacterized protein n=1 Tax=Boletus reticuloceps TaxID=495285 RepID=A0A8I2YXG9_9AGAM|nr:hypothetical protein JVT61DRAFT_10344 [Boletus reticuloceps]
MTSSRSHRSASSELLPDFKTEFHPHSHCHPLFQHQEDFSLWNAAKLAPDGSPWCPFIKEGDYLFVEITLQAGLNSSQVNGLLGLISCISQGMAKVTLRNEIDPCRSWNRAAPQVTPVSHVSPVSFDLQSEFIAQLYF